MLRSGRQSEKGVGFYVVAAQAAIDGASGADLDAALNGAGELAAKLRWRALLASVLQAKSTSQRRAELLAVMWKHAKRYAVERADMMGWAHAFGELLPDRFSELWEAVDTATRARLDSRAWTAMLAGLAENSPNAWESAALAFLALPVPTAPTHANSESVPAPLCLSIFQAILSGADRLDKPVVLIATFDKLPTVRRARGDWYWSSSLANLLERIAWDRRADQTLAARIRDVLHHRVVALDECCGGLRAVPAQWPRGGRFSCGVRHDVSALTQHLAWCYFDDPEAFDGRVTAVAAEIDGLQSGPKTNAVLLLIHRLFGFEPFSKAPATVSRASEREGWIARGVLRRCARDLWSRIHRVVPIEFKPWDEQRQGVREGLIGDLHAGPRSRVAEAVRNHLETTNGMFTTASSNLTQFRAGEDPEVFLPVHPELITALLSWDEAAIRTVVANFLASGLPARTLLWTSFWTVDQLELHRVLPAATFVLHDLVKTTCRDVCDRIHDVSPDEAVALVRVLFRKLRACERDLTTMQEPKTAQLQEIAVSTRLTELWGGLADLGGRAIHEVPDDLGKACASHQSAGAWLDFVLSRVQAAAREHLDPLDPGERGWSVVATQTPSWLRIEVANSYSPGKEQTPWSFGTGLAGLADIVTRLLDGRGGFGRNDDAPSSFSSTTIDEQGRSIYTLAFELPRSQDS